ncbi:MAG TPA: hypothetical protein VF701_04515 [Thermoanaerobaculia bacterium]
MPYEGSHDSTGCTHVGGWARDTDAPDEPVAVEILADGEHLATVEAKEFRKDLLEAGLGDGRHAFRYPLGTALHDGSPHTIEVRISGTDFQLAGTPKRVHCPHILAEPLPAALREQASREAEASRLPIAASLPGERAVPFPMRVHLVCYEDLNEWILGKITRRLRDGLETLGMDVTIGSEPDPAAEVNHHVIYWGYVDRKATLETVMVTHINDTRELDRVRRQLVGSGVEMGICMSLETVHRLAAFGIPRQQLCFVSPAHDSIIHPRKLRVGVTTRVYDDGCKREQMLANLAELLPKDQFAFTIMGSGWENVIDRMRRAGVEVEYIDHFDYDAYVELMPRLDYYLYTGMDEGSMGFVDAVAAAVPTIVTTQGFHLDVPGGITHGFQTLDELAGIFSSIASARRARAGAVGGWTWEENARKHALIWNLLACRREGRIVPSSFIPELEALGITSA